MDCKRDVPDRLRKLMLRLAQLPPGKAYSITVFLADGQSEPTWTVMLLGDIENHTRQQPKTGVLSS